MITRTTIEVVVALAASGIAVALAASILTARVGGANIGGGMVILFSPFVALPAMYYVGHKLSVLRREESQRPSR